MLDSNAESTPVNKRIMISFSDDGHLPILLANAMKILIGPSEFFVTLGAFTPPELKTKDDFDAIDQVRAQPVFRFAVSHQVFKDFIDLMTAQYELVAQQRHAAPGGTEGGDADGQ